MKTLFLVSLLFSNITFAQSAPTREVTGWFTSPAHGPSFLELEGDEAMAFMSSRYLWTAKGEKKSVILIAGKLERAFQNLSLCSI